MALTRFGYGPSTPNALVGAVGCSILLGVLGSLRPGLRFAAAVLAGLVTGVRFDPSIGIALTSGLLLGDWVVRGRPVIGRIGPPHAAGTPTLVLLALAIVRMDSGWGAYGPGPRIVVLLACVGFVGQLTRVAGASPAWPLVLVFASVPLAARGFDFKPATAIAIPLLSALLVAALLGTADMPRNWPDRLQGVTPFLLLLPGATWWMWNVSSWWAGTLTVDQIGFSAWSTYTSTLPNSVLVAKATLALPAWLLTVLTVGGAAVVHGRRTFLWASVALGVGGVWAVAIASAWVGSIESALLT